MSVEALLKSSIIPPWAAPSVAAEFEKRQEECTAFFASVAPVDLEAVVAPVSSRYCIFSVLRGFLGFKA